MKIKAKYILCVALAVMLIILPSCSMFWASNSTYSGGQILDDELMSSMRAEIIGENTEIVKPGETTQNKNETNEVVKDETESSQSNKETESDSSKEESTKKDNEETDNTVYWTKGGGVYHLYKDCGYIKSSSEILSGTVEEALEAKKSGVCSRCQNRKDKE
ncbi:MAG: hypothetical protein IKJ07_04385 [Clostridia bacterium]|nr:hypothetical protein [Clostridia bacterium]